MDDKPKRKDINKYVKPHAFYKWYDIGLELEVGDEDGVALDEIKEKYEQDKEECFDHMISKWLKESPKTQLTWRVVLEALKSLDLNKAVQSVEKNVFGGAAPQETKPPGKMETSATDQPPHAIKATEDPKELPSVVEEAAKQPNEEEEMETTTATMAIKDTSNSRGSDNKELPLVAKESSKHPTEAEEMEIEQATAELDSGDVVKSKLGSSDNDNKELLPIAVEGPPLPGDTAPTPIDYTLVLKGGRSVRGYQSELAQPGIEGKNYIVVAPTGSGKTLVAAIVISHHLQKGKENNQVDRRIVFIVDKKPLAQQQTKELKSLIPAATIECCIGDDTSNTVKSALDTGCHIIVCTAGKLVDDLREGHISLSEFTLMVFDECHHTRKRSPYAEVMLQYLKSKRDGEKLPQVMGLTASPGAGDNPNLDKKVTIDHLVNLCALMDATSGICTVRDCKVELDEHTNRPDQTIENAQGRSPYEPFIVQVVSLMKELENIIGFTSPFEPWSQKYETQVQQNKFVLESNSDPNSRNKIRVWELLRYLSRALDVYMELQYNDAMSVLEGLEIRRLKTRNEFETQLLEKLNNLISELKKLPRVDNPHLDTVKGILGDRFSQDTETRAMLFVRTKKHATSIYEWIQSLPLAKELGIRPCLVVGQVAGTLGDGMTQAEQENSFKSFREGRSNLLIVTSIGEEGIDVPACNLVIRYQHVSNEIAKAQTIGRARAAGVSEGYTILSSRSRKHAQELKNAELLSLVERILLDKHFPTGPHLVTWITKEQDKLLKQVELENSRRSQRRSTYKAEDVQLLCKTCKVPACSAAEIRVINGFCHVVPGEDFQRKLTKIRHPKPLHKAAMNRTHRILCKECQLCWGNSCIWPASADSQFPVLSCKSFVFQHVLEGPITVKKWSEAPFELQKFEGFPVQDEDDSD